jgi:hypothetical protein
MLSFFRGPLTQFMQFGYELLFSFVFILHFRLLGRFDESAVKRPTENPLGDMGLADQ